MSDEKPTQILLVDDEESLCLDTSRTLTREGFKVEYRLSAEKGLEYLEANPETDLVILDIDLGLGMKGVECLKVIKKKIKHIQVIMLTGQRDLNIGVECMKNGAFDYMTKPFKKDLFLEKARGAIEKKKLSQLEEKEKFSLIRGLADGVCHQINNRLNEFSVKTGSLIFEIGDILEKNKEYIDNNPEIKKAMDFALETAEGICKNVKKTSNIIRGIDHYADIKSRGEQFTDFNLKEVVDNAIELVRLNNGLEVAPVKVTPFDENLLIHGIGPMLLETIYGVMQNAYEAIKQKEYILDSENKENNAEEEILFTFICNPDSYVLQIKDNGIGIKEEDKQKIFAPYFTTKPSASPGIGTGLFIIRRIIEEDHKGKLSFTSDYMKGAIFTIELPKE